ncbi:unnamed protein product [Prorocentrum cordatum]|uniref:Protein S-acyltransferase n=1 Tax=Prorocentrum cordatum TaxID=2364126 RepID=A0ABN9Q0S3_9DINO|nr:unnamed protein product [Polarella glacialis]
MIATILTAVYCPGRVGLHTPAPPGWLMGLFMVNIAGCYVYLGLTMWLAMHASLRAETSATHMLTRFVRLPIPANWMLDRARKLLASYEEQNLREVFRIPFFRHRRGNSGNDDDVGDEGAIKRTRGGAAHLGDDVPAWYKKEKAVDRNFAQETMPLQARSGSNCPQHFEVFREMQQEWWPYDVYARLSLFLAFMHLTSTYCFHQLGHHFAETRSVFAVGCVILPVTILQQLILTLDICPAQLNDRPLQLPVPPHRLGGAVVRVHRHRARVQALVHRRRPRVVRRLRHPGVRRPDPVHPAAAQDLGICAPDTKAPEQMDSPGAAWWPASWCIPSNFQHSIWLVAPPKSLSTGLNDLVGEMREGTSNKASNNKPTAEEKRRDVHTALGPKGESPAWFNVRVGLVSLLIAWAWLTIGYIVELSFQGTKTPALINAPGLPNNLRDPRYRPIKPGMHEVVEVGTGGWVHGPVVGIPGSDDSGGHRRLQEMGAPEVGALAEKVAALLPYLGQIARGELPRGAAAAPPLAAAAAPPPAPLPQAPGGFSRAQIQWPALFEPRLVASGPREAHSSMMALSRHGRGVFISALEDRTGGDAPVRTQRRRRIRAPAVGLLGRLRPPAHRRLRHGPRVPRPGPVRGPLGVRARPRRQAPDRGGRRALPRRGGAAAPPRRRGGRAARGGGFPRRLLGDALHARGARGVAVAPRRGGPRPQGARLGLLRRRQHPAADLRRRRRDPHEHARWQHGARGGPQLRGRPLLARRVRPRGRARRPARLAQPRPRRRRAGPLPRVRCFAARRRWRLCRRL